MHQRTAVVLAPGAQKCTPGVLKTAPTLKKICQNCRQMVLYKLSDEDF